ncbi:hypothetical protein ACFRR7_24060 [Streptomyces sp. NPDC056909]|uniref:hypothetical protein n=1 Tax=Streptomyces sp. NPDC056909 TaxID=3345963 RepID=UPI00367E04E0
MNTTPSPVSLVELAASKQLPRHQFTDHATVRWIEAHRPDLPDIQPPPIRAASKRLLRGSAIPVDWLAEAALADSLHGIRHAMRTAALAALLAELAELDDTDAATLITAAAVHDCRRIHDNGDPGHGARAAIWLTENADAVWGHFHLDATPRAIDQAATAVRLHDLPYASFTANDLADHQRAESISDLLKAADALDRYRLPKLKWWPNPARVRVPHFARLRTIAFDLVVCSDASFLAGLSSSDAVFKALEQRELIG